MNDVNTCELCDYSKEHNSRYSTRVWCLRVPSSRQAGRGSRVARVAGAGGGAGMSAHYAQAALLASSIDIFY